MNAALAAGVDGMFTNFSDVLIGILGPRKATGLQGALDAKNSHDACLARNAKGGVGGTVPATLSLTLGAPGLLRRVHARAWRRTTRPSTTANVDLLAPATRRSTHAADPRPPDRTARSRSPAAARRSQLQQAATLLTRRPVSNDAGHDRLQAAIGAADALRTGHVREDAHADALDHHPVDCEAPRDAGAGVALSGNRTARKVRGRSWLPAREAGRVGPCR